MRPFRPNTVLLLAGYPKVCGGVMSQGPEDYRQNFWLWL